MTDFVQNILDGIAMGSTYALLGLGFTLVFGVLRRANLAYGPSIMFGAYLATWTHLSISTAIPILLLVMILGAVLIGLYVERLCFAPHRTGSSLAAMVASFALSMQIEELALRLLPKHVYSFPQLYQGEGVMLGQLSLQGASIAMLVIASTMCWIVWGLLYRTRFGLGVRATIDDPKAASLCGIRPGHVSIGIVSVASAVGAVAGFLVISAHGQVTPMLGMWATIKGLLAMMIGGMGSLPGAMAGGLLLGILEAQSQWYFGPQYRELLIYMAVFLLLAFRPRWMITRSA